MILEQSFFNRDTIKVAKTLLGKVMRRKYNGIWLSAMIIETEAYYLSEKASHASLGFTRKREALFMPPGTIYMYYSRGADTMNISTRGKGNAVLIKSGRPYIDNKTSENMISTMLELNPIKNTKRPRPVEKLCSGQTLICQSLNVTVPEWDKKSFDPKQLYIAAVI